MTNIKQFLLLLLFLLAGQLLSGLINFPASVLGLLLCFFALLFRLISVKSIEHVSLTLIKLSPLFFIPYLVDSLFYLDIIQPVFLWFIVITVGSTLITLSLVALLINFLDRRKKNGD